MDEAPVFFAELGDSPHDRTVRVRLSRIPFSGVFVASEHVTCCAEVYESAFDLDLHGVSIDNHLELMQSHARPLEVIKDDRVLAFIAIPPLIRGHLAVCIRPLFGRSSDFPVPVSPQKTQTSGPSGPKVRGPLERVIASYALSPL